MAGWTSTDAAAAPSPRPPGTRPSHGPCRPCRARRAGAPRGQKRARAGDTAGARTCAGTLAAAPAGIGCRSLRILIFHGYLLLGTGSNVYNAELAAALVRAGHEVHMLAQERSPFALEWVEAAGSWDSGTLDVESRVPSPRATVYRPDIGGLLPVYVADVYDDIEARPFNDLSEAGLEAYLTANVAAGRRGGGRARPDRAPAHPPALGPRV